MAPRVDALSYQDFYELKKIFFRYMQRVFRSCEVGDAALRPMDDAAQLETLRLLVEDVKLPEHGKRSEEAHQNALRYCSALHCGGDLAHKTDLRFAVAAALNAVLDDPTARSRWVGGWHSHHVVQACIRISPRGAGEQLCGHFVEVMGERPDSDPEQRVHRMRALAERMVSTKPGEFMERVLITTIQHVPDDVEHASLLRDGAAALAVEQLRGCVELYEGCETALTLARVMLKYFIAPGWKHIMTVWAEETDAGRLLRSCHAVAVLLECLEEPSGSGSDEDVELFRSLQIAILSRFQRLLTAQPMEQEWYSALGYTVVESDIWSRKPQRARLAKVLRHGVREWLGAELPELRKTALAKRSFRSPPVASRDWSAHGRLLLPLAQLAHKTRQVWEHKEEKEHLGRRLLDLMAQCRPPTSVVAPDEMRLREKLLGDARETVRAWQRQEEFAARMPVWSQPTPLGMSYDDVTDFKELRRHVTEMTRTDEPLREYIKGPFFGVCFPFIQAYRMQAGLARREVDEARWREAESVAP